MAGAPGKARSPVQPAFASHPWHGSGTIASMVSPIHRYKALLLLECQVFSSDQRSIKPSPRLFLQALGMLDLPPQEVLFIGDSLERDIAPAKALGVATCWVTACGGGADVADFCIPSIAALTVAPTPACG